MLRNTGISAVILALGLAATPALAQSRGGGTEPEFRGIFADLGFARRLMAEEKYVEAEGLLHSLISLKDDSALIWFQLALCQQLQSKTDDALKSVHQVLEIDNTRANAHLMAAELLAAKEPKRAIAHLRLLQKHAGDDFVALRRGVKICMVLKQVELGDELLAEAVRLHPNSAETLEVSAQAKILAGDKPGAIKIYRKLSKLQPFDPYAPESLARLLAFTGDKAGAVEAFKRSLKALPSNLRVRRSLVELLVELEADAAEVAEHRGLIAKYEAAEREAAREAAERAAAETPATPPGATKPRATKPRGRRPATARGK